MGERVTVAIVGGGRVGHGFLGHLAREERWIQTVGVVTRNAARQRELSNEFGVPAFGSVDALLETTRPDVVCVVNANEDHAPATLAALKAGAHVLCEKPMAPTLAECEAMVAAEKASGKHLQIGFEYPFGTMTKRLRQLVDEGFFGAVTWASVLDSRGHWWSGDPHTDGSEYWKLDRARGGGIVFHCGIHQLDLIRGYLGDMESVTAFVADQKPLPYYPDDVPSNVTLMLKAKSGAVANFQIFHNRAPTWYRENPPFHPDWRQAPGHEFNISLVGTAGSCDMRIYEEKLHLFRFDHEKKDTVFERTEVFSPNHPNKSHHDMTGLLLNFIQRVRDGLGALVPASDALETMRLAYACEDAIARREPVQLSDYR
jgi:predicted dehydrogenase